MNLAFVNLLVRWIVLALGVVLGTRLVPGIRCDSGATLFLVVLVLSLFNAVLKPLLLLFTLPFIVLTLGVGVWLINALVFLLVSAVVPGFHVAGFGAALVGALIVSVTNLVLTRLLMPPPPGPPPPGPRGGTKADDVIDI